MLFKNKKSESELIQFSKNHYHETAELREKLEHILANDMLTLYDVSKFLESKKKSPKKGFSPI